MNRMRAMVLCAATLWSPAAAVAGWAGALPVVDAAQTSYGRSIVRLESRPSPATMTDAGVRRAAEQAIAAAGADARWIAVIDPNGVPYIPNAYLTGGPDTSAYYQTVLKAWTDDLHQAGMAAVSWLPMAFSQRAWAAHPEWRQVSIRPWAANSSAEAMACCFNTGYGQALIDYLNDALDKTGLDGIWIDGGVVSPIWELPYPLTCACATCKVKFKHDTGMEMPTAPDWSSPAFRRWLHWRFDSFAAFLAKLDREIHTRHPRAVIALNHYHRIGIPWVSGVPLDRFDANIISASEASGAEQTDLTVRLCRAYGRSQAEVWRPLAVDPVTSTAELLGQHALQCYLAGGNPSFGGDIRDPATVEAIGRISPIMKTIAPLAGGPSIPYAAVHLSQQAETFHYGRVDSGPNLYWESLANWTRGLMARGVAPDFLFDSELTSAALARFRVAVLTLSPALEPEQARAALEFANGGGVLVLGLGAGQLDRDGEPLAVRELEQALGYTMGDVPPPDAWGSGPLRLAEPGEGGARLAASGNAAPLELAAAQWQPLLVREGTTPAQPVAAERRWGQGRVILLAADPGDVMRGTWAQGGDTSLSISAEQAAPGGGQYSLRFIDGAQAPQSFYPDLETNLPAFGAPRWRGGELEFDLRVDAGSQAVLQVRSQTPPILGPTVLLGAGNAIQAGGKVLPMRFGEWLRVRARWNFARDAEPSSFTLTVTSAAQHDWRVEAGGLASDDAAYRQTNWFVLYGPASTAGRFYLDNLVMRAIAADGSARLVAAQDFEDAPSAQPGLTGATSNPALANWLAGRLLTLAPPPIAIELEGELRAGLFAPRAGSDAEAGAVLVHLHNRAGTLAGRPMAAEKTGAAGPRATLRTQWPVRRARALLSGQELVIDQEGSGSRIATPPVEFYEVIELTPEPGSAAIRTWASAE